MKFFINLFLSAVLLNALSFAAYSQFTIATPTPTPTPPPRISESLLRSLTAFQQGTPITRERREQAYAKLMEGQRFIWRGNPMRGPGGQVSSIRSAKTALQKAVELDPELAEAYTALAELAISAPPNDIDEAVALAGIATKIEPDNFGARRILARLFTYKSRLNNGVVDAGFAAKAVTEWKEVARLDPRNAEAWAFLSELYSYQGKRPEQIAALRKWVAAASPLETQFFRRVMGGNDALTPENASLKLAAALIKAGQSAEAVDVVSELIADDPENTEAVDLLREAVEVGGGSTAEVAIAALKRAISVKPGSLELIGMLAQAYAREGRVDEAISAIRSAETKLHGEDSSSAADMSVSLGDIYRGADRFDEASAAYEKALTLRGISSTVARVAGADREFVMQVLEKLISVHKSMNRGDVVLADIQRARQLLGRDDLFADRALIAFFRETGKKVEALGAVRSVRVRTPGDYGMLRLEATVLTELGRVDEAVALIRSLIVRKTAVSGPTGSVMANGPGSVVMTPAMTDDFSNLLFISQLLSKANRGKDAETAANEAYSIANGEERKQIAKLTLATAQQMSGNFAAAEATLNEILKKSPGNPIALNNLGYYLIERNERLNEAVQLVQRALRVDPTNPSYLDSLGWGQFKLGRLDEAEKNLRAAARLDASSETVFEHLGDLYFKQGKRDKAKLSWQRALERASDPDDVNRIREKLR